MSASVNVGSCGKTRSIWRTNRCRRSVGSRNGKPRYDWSKARRRRGGWTA